MRGKELVTTNDTLQHTVLCFGESGLVLFHRRPLL